jgi:hypothetical protein
MASTLSVSILCVFCVWVCAFTVWSSSFCGLCLCMFESFLLLHSLSHAHHIKKLVKQYIVFTFLVVNCCIIFHWFLVVSVLQLPAYVVSWPSYVDLWDVVLSLSVTYFLTYMRFGTWNVRSLYRSGSLKERDRWEDQGVGGRMGSELILGRLAWGVCGLNSTVSGQGPVAGCCECGDESWGSYATELVS